MLCAKTSLSFFLFPGPERSRDAARGRSALSRRVGPRATGRPATPAGSAPRARRADAAGGCDDCNDDFAPISLTHEARRGRDERGAEPSPERMPAGMRRARSIAECRGFEARPLRPLAQSCSCGHTSR